MRCTVSVQNTVLMVPRLCHVPPIVHFKAVAVRSNSIPKSSPMSICNLKRICAALICTLYPCKQFAIGCPYSCNIVGRLMCYSGKPPSSFRKINGFGVAQRRGSSVLSSVSASVVASQLGDASVHYGFASNSGMFLVRQLRMRFCLPTSICAVLELSARVSRFSSTRESAADLLVAATSLESSTSAGSSGSKIIDALRKNACIIACEVCLDSVSNLPSDFMVHEKFTTLLLDKVLLSTAALMKLVKLDTSSAVQSALARGVLRAINAVNLRIKNDAYQSVVSDMLSSKQEDFVSSKPGSDIVDVHAKQAQIELRASCVLCELIISMCHKLSSFDLVLEQFTDEVQDGQWYSTLALDQAAKDSLFQAQRVIMHGLVPSKLIEGLLRLLVLRMNKHKSLSFDDCTTELWKLISLFFELRGLLKDIAGLSTQLLEGIPAIFEYIVCGPGPSSWLQRFAVVQEQQLQEAIVADELHSLVEVSFSGSRVYLWLTDFIAILDIMQGSQSAAEEADFNQLLAISNQRFWEVLINFVGKSLIEIKQLCESDIESSEMDESSAAAFGLTSVVRGIGQGVNAALGFLDPTATDGANSYQKGVFATIKQTAFNTVRAVREGKGIVSAAAEATKGTVKTAFSAVASSANIVVQAGALVASGVDAAVSGAANVAGISQSKSSKEVSESNVSGSIMFAICLMRAIEDAITSKFSASQSMLSAPISDKTDDLDIESAVQRINVKKQYVEPLCNKLYSKSAGFFEQLFRSMLDDVLDGKQEAIISWEFGVSRAVNAIIAYIPDVNPDRILKSAAQDLYCSLVEVIAHQFCIAVACCKRESGGGFSKRGLTEEEVAGLLRKSAEKLAQELRETSQNEFSGCASDLLSSFSERVKSIIEMQFGSKLDDLRNLLDAFQVNQGEDTTGQRCKDLMLVLKNRFERDTAVQTLLMNLEHRKWRMAFDIPDADIFCDSVSASIQDKNKDRSKFVKGMLYITHDHICFLEDIDAARDRGHARKQTQPPVDLGPFLVPSSPARLRIKWTRGDRVAVTPQDTTKIKVKGNLDAAMYQNALILTQFKPSQFEPSSPNSPSSKSSSITYLKCFYAEHTYANHSVLLKELSHAQSGPRAIP